jgi:hypothetical protein
MLRRNVRQGRQVLRMLLTTPLRLQPVGATWKFTGRAALGKVLAGLVSIDGAKSVASPTGFEPSGESRSLGPFERHENGVDLRFRRLG